ncbi:hypothetical protein VTN77DRAFT_445 [Rasamsonia byssochlamydoides]|uniref:uncharacterized protein n=1 Tax=Rasamsonia byssochlamydoides TaxID=89139 RepID=UPI0037435F5A
MPSYGRLLAALCGLATTAVAVHPLIVDGKDFVDSVTKDRFQIIGIDYQPGGSSGFNGSADPLSDKDACLRDAALMQRLGINTIRVYNLATNVSHDDCASIFNAAGIYMLLDVNSPLPNGSLDRTAPWTTYDLDYLQRIFGVVEAFKNYPNTLGFFAGNEVINEQSVVQVPAYIRAVQRDLKDYIAKNVDRSIPVGYSAADVRDILVDTANYLSCDLSNATSSRSDFFGLNSYSWCGDSSYTKSGYDVLTADFANASLPAFFSEYGCNLVEPRTFTEVQALYGEDMTQAFSGGLVYEWTQEANNYGLVQINDNGTVTLLIDYENLQKQYNALDLKRIESSNTTQTSVKAPPCSPSLISTSGFLKTFDLPARPDGADDLIENGLKGATVGKLVSVSSQTISTTVYDSNGNVISGIELRVLSNDQANEPGSNTSGTTSNAVNSTSTAGSATSTSKTGAASRQHSSGVLSTFGAVVALAVSLAW